MEFDGMKFRKIDVICPDCGGEFVALVEKELPRSLDEDYLCNHCNLVKHGLAEAK